MSDHTGLAQRMGIGETAEALVAPVPAAALRAHVLEASLEGRTARAALKSTGACLRVELRPPGEPAATPMTVLAMVDTGSIRSAVDVGVLDALGLRPHGQARAGTAQGARVLSVYALRVTILGACDAALSLELPEVFGVDLDGGEPYAAALGRDVLSMFTLVYHGPSGRFALALPPAAEERA